MAFAIMLATGSEPVAALTAIRRARPIAAIGDNLDSLDWWMRVGGTPDSEAETQLTAVRAGHREHPLDVVRIVRGARALERSGWP